MITPGEIHPNIIITPYECTEKPKSTQTPFGMITQSESSLEILIGRMMHVRAVQLPFVVVDFIDSRTDRYLLDTRKLKCIEIDPKVAYEYLGEKMPDGLKDSLIADTCTKGLKMPAFLVDDIGSKCQCSKCREERGE